MMGRFVLHYTVAVVGPTGTKGLGLSGPFSYLLPARGGLNVARIFPPVTPYSLLVKTYSGWCEVGKNPEGPHMGR